MYGFRKESYSSLQDAAIEAVQRIYGAGLMFRQGRLSAGGNNVMADNAAQAFSRDDLTYLAQSATPLNNALAHIISLRQDYANGSGDEKLQQIYDAAQIMKAHGFKMRDEPFCVGLVQSQPASQQQAPQEAPQQSGRVYNFGRGFGLG